MQPIFVICAVLFLTIGETFELGQANPANGKKDMPPEPPHDTTTASPTSSTNPASSTATSVVPPHENGTTTAKPTSPSSVPTTKAPEPTTKIPEKSTSTKLPPVSTSTQNVKPDVTTALPPPSETGKKTGLDGISFMSGILASVAILCVASLTYKFYKIRTERSYHTL